MKMITKEKVPMRCSAIETGVEKQMTRENHPVPILTHYPRRRKRVRLVWTPVNVSLLILLAAILFIVIVKAIVADPLEYELISMANSVFTV